MSDRYKYAVNGIYKCENFAQQVEQNRFPAINIGPIGGIPRWYLKCTLITEDGQTFLYPSISCDVKPKVQLCTFFNVLKKDGSSSSMRREKRRKIANLYTCHVIGKPYEVSDLLNPKNEYLDDGSGSLSIEYKMHIDAIIDNHNTWKFNFHDTVFNYTGEENQMVKCTFRGYIRRELYFSAEILNFHCPQLVGQTSKTILDSVSSYDFIDCLQILHGVPLRIDYCYYFDILKIAHSFNLSNVIHYCDRPYIERYGVRCISFHRVVELNLRHILAEKLKCRKQKEVVKIAKKLDFTQATGETMKTFVAKILYA